MSMAEFYLESGIDPGDPASMEAWMSGAITGNVNGAWEYAGRKYLQEDPIQNSTRNLELTGDKNLEFHSTKQRMDLKDSLGRADNTVPIPPVYLKMKTVDMHMLDPLAGLKQAHSSASTETAASQPPALCDLSTLAYKCKERHDQWQAMLKAAADESSPLCSVGSDMIISMKVTLKHYFRMFVILKSHIQEYIKQRQDVHTVCVSNTQHWSHHPHKLVHVIRRQAFAQT
jgi:hypothetical protein